MHGHKNVYEGDLNENDNFNDGHQTSRRVHNAWLQNCAWGIMGAILTKMAILEMGN